jgi:hypothetical protein
LEVEGAVDDLVGCVELDLNFAGIGIGDEGLMLSKCGGSENDSHGEECK